LGWLQWLHLVMPGAESFQWVRRFLLRDFEILLFG
jgi:hypothetical protein